MSCACLCIACIFTCVELTLVKIFFIQCGVFFLHELRCVAGDIEFEYCVNFSTSLHLSSTGVGVPEF